MRTSASRPGANAAGVSRLSGNAITAQHYCRRRQAMSLDWCEAIVSSVRAALLGCLRPCSPTLKRVRTDTPSNAANWLWDSGLLARLGRIVDDANLSNLHLADGLEEAQRQDHGSPRTLASSPRGKEAQSSRARRIFEY